MLIAWGKVKRVSIRTIRSQVCSDNKSELKGSTTGWKWAIIQYSNNNCLRYSLLPLVTVLRCNYMDPCLKGSYNEFVGSMVSRGNA